MSSLKRKEGLRKGLQRISEKRLQDVLETANHEGLTAKPVHEIRKTIKSLRATLRLTRGALTVEARKARNQALKDLAGRFSGPRDAAVVLSAVSQLQKSLASRANALIPAESYQDAADAVRCLKGRFYPSRLPITKESLHNPNLSPSGKKRPKRACGRLTLKDDDSRVRLRPRQSHRMSNGTNYANGPKTLVINCRYLRS